MRRTWKAVLTLVLLVGALSPVFPEAAAGAAAGDPGPKAGDMPVAVAAPVTGLWSALPGNLPRLPETALLLLLGGAMIALAGVMKRYDPQR